MWWAYAQLTATRQPAPVIAPITWTEILAFDHGANAGLTSWERSLIRRVDDAVRRVAIGESAPSSQISARNASGVAGLFRTLKARKNKGAPA